jgi:lipopolysaccharide biosynthesis protein
MNTIQYLAYYLPQFHPILENDQWWGKGFTEWTNVTKAKPLFKGHYQPILPADLGFYDLRVPEVQEAQAALAKEYGIDGFIYYQYWFGNGKMLLEKPAEAMLKNKNIELPFCFCWANETWRGIWHGLDNPEILIEQTYQGEKGYKKYFEYLVPFFKDERYIKVENKPMFHIYRIKDIPDVQLFFDTFNESARNLGFDGIYFVLSTNETDLLDNVNVHGVVGLDIFNEIRYNSEKFLMGRYQKTRTLEKRIKRFFGIGRPEKIGKRKKPLLIDYEKHILDINDTIPHDKYMPCVFPNWDNSARSGMKSMIFKHTNPNNWKVHLQNTIQKLREYPANPPFIIIKSWNEWAEGNHLEPDRKYGLKWLEVVKQVKNNEE